jgi:hypothetical protein
MSTTPSNSASQGMASLFAITAKPPALNLTQGGAGAVAFTVSFGTASPAGTVPFPAHANLVPQDTAIAPWLILDGPAARKFTPNSTEVYTVKVGPPADAAPGNYAFRLDMVGDDNPDEQYTQGPTIALGVVPGEGKTRHLPRWWWIVAAAIAALIIAVLAFLLLRRGGDTIPVPDVVTGNLTQDQAQLVLERACTPAPCFVVAAGQRFDIRVPRGRVISSNPRPGDQAAKGSTVTILVSLGPPLPGVTVAPPTNVILAPRPSTEVLPPELVPLLTPTHR